MLKLEGSLLSYVVVSALGTDSFPGSSASIHLTNKGIATSDASKEALAYTYTTATLIDIDECGLRTLIPEPSSSLVFMPTCRDAKEEGRLTTQTLTNQW